MTYPNTDPAAQPAPVERGGFMTINFVAGVAIIAFIMAAVALILILVT